VLDFLAVFLEVCVPTVVQLLAEELAVLAELVGWLGLDKVCVEVLLPVVESGLLVHIESGESHNSCSQ
jgi:hypothetical protein